MSEEVERAEIEALLATRRELGRDYEKDLAESFAEKVEQAIERRAQAGAPERRDRDHLRMLLQFVVATASVAALIPIAIVCANIGGEAVPVLVMSVLAIIGVNISFSDPPPWRR